MQFAVKTCRETQGQLENLQIIKVNKTRFDQQGCYSEKTRWNRAVYIQLLIVLEFEPQNLSSMGL